MSHISGYQNREMHRKLCFTGAGKKIDASTGLTALQLAGPRVMGVTYDRGRNAAKRMKRAK